MKNNEMYFFKPLIIFQTIFLVRNQESDDRQEQEEDNESQ